MAENKMESQKLNQLIAAMKTAPRVRIGILNNTKRRDSGLSNAEVGMEHEYGTEIVPQRSFLRMPLTDHLGKFIDKSAQSFDNDSLKEVLTKKDLTPWMKKLAVIAEAVVMEGFATGGFGKWVQWSTGYSNQTGMILVDTHQLRDSITSEVVK